MKPFDLAVGEWWGAPASGNYRLQDVFATPNPGGSQSGMMDGQGGAVYDSLRKEMVIGASGGHALCADNSVNAYSFDPASPYFLQWRRKNAPSTRSDGTSVIVYPDGTPSAHHLYSSCVYIPTLDQYALMPGGYRWGSSAAVSVELFTYDMTNETPNTATASAWTRKTDPANWPTPEATSSPHCVFDPITGLVVQYNYRGVCTWNPNTDTYTVRTNWDYSNSQAGYTPVYIPGSPAHMLLIGSGYSQCKRLDNYDTSAGSTNQGSWGMSGATAIQSVVNPGVVYCPNAGKIFAWGGTLAGGTDNRDYYEIDFTSKVSTRRTGTGVIPTNPNSTYTNGRFMYIGDGLVALVNRTSETMYFLRVAAATGRTPQGVLTPTALTAGQNVVSSAVAVPVGAAHPKIELNGNLWPSDSVVKVAVEQSEDGGTTWPTKGHIITQKSKLLSGRCHVGLPTTANGNASRRVRTTVELLSGSAITAGAVVTT